VRGRRGIEVQVGGSGGSDVDSIGTNTSQDSRHETDHNNKPQPPAAVLMPPPPPSVTNNHNHETIDEEEEVVIRPKARVPPVVKGVNAQGLTKEEIELRNLRKKTRKRTRKFEIDGVQMTTTTSRVIYGDDENGRIYDDHDFRKQELRELKMLQKQEKKQQTELYVKEQQAKEQQDRRFEQERSSLEKTYEADMDMLARQHKQLVEKTEQTQENELRSSSKRIRSEQEQELKIFRENLKQEIRLLKQEVDLFPKDKRKDEFKQRRSAMELDHVVVLVLALLVLLLGLLAVALALLGIAVRQLVVDQVVQGNDRAHHGSQVDDQHLVVGLHVHGARELVVGYVGQQVEDVLQLVDNLVVDGHLAVPNALQILLDVAQLGVQSLQAHQLVGDLL